MTGLRGRALLAAAIGGAVLLFATIAGATPVKNGGFETGDFTGWTTANTGPGQWYVSGKIITPISDKSWFGPAQQEFAAVTDQPLVASSMILYQMIKAGKNTKIQAMVYYKNRTSLFCTPPAGTLLNDFTVCNQQYRIDIMRDGANVYSTAPADVLKNLYQTKSTSKKSINPTFMNFKLGSISGTVMLRFAVTANQNIFNGSVDNVQINNG